LIVLGKEFIREKNLEISRKELQDIIQNLNKHNPLINLYDTLLLRHYFNTMDVDRTNSISYKELEVCFRKMDIVISNQQLVKIFNDIDLNHDGQITWDEMKVKFRSKSIRSLKLLCERMMLSSGVDIGVENVPSIPDVEKEANILG